MLIPLDSETYVNPEAVDYIRVASENPYWTRIYFRSGETYLIEQPLESVYHTLFPEKHTDNLDKMDSIIDKVLTLSKKGTIKWELWNFLR